MESELENGVALKKTKPLSKLSRLLARQYPIYPSSKIIVPWERYIEAVKALKERPNVFCDGSLFLVPEAEHGVIKMLCSEFNGVVNEAGCGKEGEYAHLALNAGVDRNLVKLGAAIWDITGLTAIEMVKSALNSPEQTLNNWKDLFIKHGCYQLNRIALWKN